MSGIHFKIDGNNSNEIHRHLDKVNLSKYEYNLLRKAHQRYANKLDCTFGNFGWVVDNNAICSKTSNGYLTTKRIMPNNYEHTLEQYS
jgi:hypothetical protein